MGLTFRKVVHILPDLHSDCIELYKSDCRLRIICIEVLNLTFPDMFSGKHWLQSGKMSVKYQLIAKTTTNVFLIQTEAERRRREAGVKQSIEIRLRSCTGWS